MNGEKNNKYCNCQSSSNTKILQPNITHSYCEKCGSILVKNKDGEIFYTLKSNSKQRLVELNPIEYIKAMKKKTEEEYPFLNNEYNINEINYNDEMKSINLYLRQRKMIILTLQKMMKMFDFSDLIFFQTLFYLDTYLSHNMTEDTSEKEILYYLVGYFLVSAKLKETDIYEPSLNSFCCLKKRIYLSVEKMLYYEIICLKTIQYNLFSYSAYDWISELINIGFVFNCEIDKNNSIILIKGHRHSVINTISKYAIKLLLNMTVKNIYIKYSPIYVAFSLIQIAREKYLNKKLIHPKLYNNLISLFGVNVQDFKKCYKELKNELEENNVEVQEDLEKDKKKEESTGTKNALDSMAVDITHRKMDKNVVVANKTKSSTTIINIFENERMKKEINKEANKEGNKEGDDNIIIVNEDNEVINNDQCKNSKDSNLKKEEEKSNKMRSSVELNKMKIQSRILIDCDSRIYASNDNLPKISPILEENPTFENNNTTRKKESKFLSSDKGKKFLLTASKTLNPVKNKNEFNSDNKRYFQSSFGQQQKLNNKDSNNQREEFDTMRKFLFCDNSNYNHNKKLSTKESISIFGNSKKIQSTNVLPKIPAFENVLKEEKKEKNEEIQNNVINDSKRRVCKSKFKSKNNLSIKETKTYVANKRNQSTNNHKKLRTIKSNLDINKK